MSASFSRIQPRPLSIKVSLEAQKECLLGESVSLTLVLQNDESEAVDDIELSALLTSPRDACKFTTVQIDWNSLNKAAHCFYSRHNDNGRRKWNKP